MFLLGVFSLVGFITSVVLLTAFVFRYRLIKRYYDLLKAERELKALTVKYLEIGRKLKRIEDALKLGLEGDTLPLGEEGFGELSLPVFVGECDTPCALPISAPVVRGLHGELHRGVDLPAPEGTPVFATARGVVEETGRDDRLGLFVRIKHGKGYKTLYAHLSEVAVKEGDSVKTGQIVGFVGSSGLSTGPHLHYEVYVGDEVVDPVKLTE